MLTGYFLATSCAYAAKRDRAGDHVLDGRAGQVLGAAGRDLDDAVALRLGEALQRRVERLRGRHVDRGVRERAGLGAVEHLGVDLGGSDGHVCAPYVQSGHGVPDRAVLHCGLSSQRAALRSDQAVSVAFATRSGTSRLSTQLTTPITIAPQNAGQKPSMTEGQVEQAGDPVDEQEQQGVDDEGDQPQRQEVEDAADELDDRLDDRVDHTEDQRDDEEGQHGVAGIGLPLMSMPGTTSVVIHRATALMITRISIPMAPIVALARTHRCPRLARQSTRQPGAAVR